MRVLHIAPHMRSIGNGIVNCVVDLAVEQARRGDAVVIAAEPGEYSQLLRRHGVGVCEVSMRRRPLDMWKTVSSLNRAIRCNHVEIVHAHTPTAVLFARVAIGSRRVRLVATVHNEFERGKFAAILADRIVAVSKANLVRIRRWAGVGRVNLVMNGVVGSARHRDISTVELARPAVIFVGGLNYRKGVDVLLRAFRLVLSQEWTVPPTLYIVGDGPNRAELEQLARDLALDGSSLFVGFSPVSTAYMQAGDLLVAPSRDEPFGLVIAEAREAGCAIIASEVGGIPEVLDSGEVGMLVAPDDPVVLADAIGRVLRDEHLRHRMQISAVRNIEWLSVSRMTDDMAELYSTLL